MLIPNPSKKLPKPQKFIRGFVNNKISFLFQKKLIKYPFKMETLIEKGKILLIWTRDRLNRKIRWNKYWIIRFTYRWDLLHEYESFSSGFNMNPRILTTMFKTPKINEKLSWAPRHTKSRINESKQKQLWMKKTSC